MRFTFAYNREGNVIPPVTPSVSDLVELGILTKQISEFSDSDIGTEVSIPYSNEGSGISGPIVFEVVGVNHHVTTEHPKTITLMTKNIIRKASFDAAEPNNTNSYRKSSGNNRWSVSNIRQWLNSGGAAGSWWSAQHEYDAPPIAANVSHAAGAYADAPGFLAGFSADVLQHFTDITNTTNLNNVDGGGTETTVDKVFLPSFTEMGLATGEGSHLSIRYPDANSRIKSGADGIYWMRSPYGAMYPQNVGFINAKGNSPNYTFFIGAFADNGITPIIVLH